MTVTVTSIFYYPIKGAGGTALAETSLDKSGIRYDRRYAIAFGDSLQPLFSAEKWRPWNHCHTLKKHEKMARLAAAVSTDPDGGTEILHVQLDGKEAVAASPSDPAGLAELNNFFREFFAAPAACLVDSEARPLWDEDGMPLTLLSVASVQSLAAAEDTPLETTRFRANIVFSGLPAWEEESLTGTAHIGEVRLTLAGGVPRCAATTVNPATATRDIKVPQSLVRHRQHSDMGLFATVAQGGSIAAGQEIRFEPA